MADTGTECVAHGPTLGRTQPGHKWDGWSAFSTGARRRIPARHSFHCVLIVQPESPECACSACCACSGLSGKRLRETLGAYGLREASVEERQGSGIDVVDMQNAQAPCQIALLSAAMQVTPASGWISTSAGEQQSYRKRSSTTCSPHCIACACPQALHFIPSQKHE